MRANTRSIEKEIARERMDVLFALAMECASADSTRARAYVRHLKRISEHSKVDMTKRMRDSICRKCGMVLIPGSTARVKIASSKRHVIYECASCKSPRHVHY